MKIKITKKVTDKETKEQHFPGQIVEKSQERGKAFIAKGYAELVLENQKGEEITGKEEVSSKAPEKDEALGIEDTQETSNNPMNLKELAAYVSEMDSVEDLEGLSEVEKAGANRKGAFKIIDERIAELSE